MTTQGIYYGFAFAGNPIIYRQHLDPTAGIREGTYRVKLGGETIYEGKFSLPVSLNLSEIVSGEVREVSVPYWLTDEWVRKAVDLQDSDNMTLSLIVEYDNGADWENLPVTVLKGRVTNTEYDSYALTNQDIFSARFLNPEANFFMTTRTKELLLEIPEAELYPLCFLMPGERCIRVDAGGEVYESGKLQRGLYWLDLERIRKKIFSSALSPQLVNEFLVGYSDSDSRVRVVITRCEPFMMRTLMRFRNTYDIPELMAFDSVPVAKPVMTDDAEREYLLYKERWDSYQNEKEGSPVRLTLTLDTGEVAAKDIRRLLELISSRKVEIMNRVGQWLPVTVTAGDMEIPLRPEEPLRYQLTLTLAREDLSLLDWLNPETAEPWRLFSVEHNDKFN